MLEWESAFTFKPIIRFKAFWENGLDLNTRLRCVHSSCIMIWDVWKGFLVILSLFVLICIAAFFQMVLMIKLIHMSIEQFSYLHCNRYHKFFKIDLSIQQKDRKSFVLLLKIKKATSCLDPTHCLCSYVLVWFAMLVWWGKVMGLEVCGLGPKVNRYRISEERFGLPQKA